MVDIRIVIACTQCRVHWDRDTGQAACTSDGHEHQEFEVHRHREAITLPDGTEITAVSFDPANPYARDQEPDYGLYLDHHWQPPWPHDQLDWPDFGLPADAEQVTTALRAALDRAQAGERVEVGCLGGHGRTGTALACLAVLTGQPADRAVGWVRDSYCPAAIETADQEAYVGRFAR